MASPDLSGVRSYIRRTLTSAQIRQLSSKCHLAILAGEDQVAITSSGFEGGNASGVLTASALDLGRICEEVLADLGEGPTAGGRALFVRADMSGQEVA
jgi:hypothetical protein